MTETPAKTILIGYGNVDRQDDGAAWFVLQGIAKQLGRPFPAEPSDEIPPNQPDPQLFFTLQLTPELAEEIAAFERVCFIDAHTGNIPTDVQVKPIQAAFQQSPFTHHLTPETLLSFCKTLYNQEPEALLVSVRGYKFDFVRGLSEKTREYVEEATQAILSWLQV